MHSNFSTVAKKKKTQLKPAKIYKPCESKNQPSKKASSVYKILDFQSEKSEAMEHRMDEIEAANELSLRVGFSGHSGHLRVEPISTVERSNPVKLLPDFILVSNPPHTVLQK